MTKWMVGLAALLTLVLAPSAWADYGRVDQFADQPADGSAVHQQRIAINPATHTIYVADTVGDQVRVFTPSGTSATEGTPFGAGDLTDPLGIAVDAATGDVYVSDDNDILKYDNTGSRDATFTSPGMTGPLGFDQAADQLVVGAGTQVQRFATTGTAVAGATFDGTSGSTAFAGIQDLAVDSAGNVVVVDSDGSPTQGTGTSRVERFTADGTHQLTFGPVPMAATVAIEPGSDRVAVSGNQDGNVRGELPTVTMFDPVAPGTPAGSAALPDSLMYSAIRALAFDGSRLYVGTDVGDYFGGFDYGSITIQAFEEGPDVRLSAPSAITTDSATVSGTINPQGGGTDTTYRFELSADDGATWTAVDPDNDGDENAGHGNAATPVSETVTDLTSSTTYRVRLVAVRGTVTITSPVQTFTTGDVAPDVALGDADVTDVTAVLRGRVTPNRIATTYVFEYGTTTAYGRQYPAAPKTIDDLRTGDRPAVATVPMLQPGTTYHYRLVATNGAGTARTADGTFTTRPAPTRLGADTCSNAAVRARQGARVLGDCRAYEMISPVEKSGNPILDYLTTQSAPSADAVVYPAGGDFGGAEASLQRSFYLARRDATGWTTRSADAPQTNRTHDIVAKATLFFDRDLSTGVQFSTRALAPGANDDRFNLYRYSTSDGLRSTLMTEPDPVKASALANEFVPVTATETVVYATDDVRHIVFQSRMLAVAGTVPDKVYVYERVDGETRLVSRLPDGSVPDRDSWLIDVSPDGRRILFETIEDDTNYRALYMWENGVTKEIASGIPNNHSQVSASRDLEVVYFIGGRPLVPGATSRGVYRYEVSTEELTYLTPLRDPADYSVSADGLLASEDGITVSFSARSSLAGDAVPDVVGQVYAWRAGELHFVGQFASKMTFSPSGRYMAFYSSDGRTTGFDTSGCGGACIETYLYDVVTNKLTCASCRNVGPRNENANFGPQGKELSGFTGRFVLDNGRMFFSTPEALVPTDVNGRSDVYQFKDGVNTLITSGTSPNDALFRDASPDGESVFFTTSERIVGQDRDSLVDLYVARAHGGFASQDEESSVAARCEGDACQAAPQRPVPTTPAASITFSNSGDGPAAVRPSAPKVAVRAPVRGTAATLRVTVSTPGRIRLTGPGLAAAQRTAAKAGTYVLTARLTAASRRALARKRRLSVRVRVAFTPATGRAKTVSTTLTFTSTPARKGRR
jgi:hypothetical protein